MSDVHDAGIRRTSQGEKPVRKPAFTVRQRAGAKDQSGFTLIELLVVIIILGILSAVVVFAVRGVNDKGDDAAKGIDVRTIRTAQEAFCANNGRYAFQYELVPQYLSEEPTLSQTTPTSGGRCGTGPMSNFEVTCDASRSGCLESGATPLGTMVVAGGATGGSLNPATTSNGGVHSNSEAMFNGLLAFDASNQVVPDLAVSLPAITDNADGTQDALFTLRPGMRWHNGTPIIADDVKFTFEEALIRGHSRTAASVGPALGVTGSGNGAVTPADAITLPDGPNGLKVKFHFRYKYTPLLKQMNVTEAPIIPKNYFSSCAVNGGDGTLINDVPTCTKNRAPVGSGPFKMGSISTSAITLEKNPNYFKPGLPRLAKVVQQNTASGAVAGALKAARGTVGSIDVGSPPGNELPPAKNDFATPDYAITGIPRGTGGGNCITTLSFNLWAKGQSAADVLADPGSYNHPILKNLAVRRAVYQAFDRQGAFDAIDFGKGRLADSPLHSALAGAYAAQAGIPAFNVAAARQTLQDAGWLRGATDTEPRKSDGREGLPPEGTELRFDSIHFDTGSQAAYGTRLKNNLREVGIDLTSRPLSGANVQTAMKDRTYDTTFVSYCNGDDPTIGVRRQYHSSQISAVAFANTSGIREKKANVGDGTMDDLWDRGVQATGPSFTSIYGQIQQKAVDILPMVWMTETLNTRVNRTVCTGLNHQNTGLFVETASCAP